MRRFTLVGLGLVFLLAAPPALARWSFPTNWPVDRLIENLGRFVQDHPEDSDALYCLGRVHSYVFSFQTAQIAVFANEVMADGAARSGTVESWEQQMKAGTFPPPRLDRLVPERSVQDRWLNLGEWLRPEDKRTPRPPMEERARLAHLASAIELLRRAVALVPERAQAHLTLANVLEQGAGLAGQLDAPALLGLTESEIPEADQEKIERALSGQVALDSECLERALHVLERERSSSDPSRKAQAQILLRRWWLDCAIESYRRAYELSIPGDRALDTQPMNDPRRAGSPLESLVSYEAGKEVLRLLRERGPIPPDLEPFVSDVSAALIELERKPVSGWMTPLLLTLDGCRSLDELIAPEHRVLFDLDGDLVEEPSPWIRPEAGWLVWDPDHRGRITSGRQLFGSSSGWFFFPDGYRVLDALDDDRDGELTGAELAGIAVWFDRDSDGVSDRGEVVSVEDLGIVALATEATERLGRSLGNLCGLELHDGRLLPTYDWVLERQQP